MEQADPIHLLFARARKHGIPMAAICKSAGIDPTTPSRWKRGKNGATVEKVVQLGTALDSLIADRAA